VTYVIEPLSEHHDPGLFDCGRIELNEWLHKHAQHVAGQGTRTYAMVQEGIAAILGYFALAPHLVEREDVPKRIGRGAPHQIPAILLAKLALHQELHGSGLGGELLVRALRTVVTAARTAGGKLVVVDAIDNRAAAFYEHHDFRPVPGNPYRLVQKLSTVAKSLGIEWP
jgi:GNAT superfamily N-acetyltransferase